MHATPLEQLRTIGQSMWLDYIRRDLVLGGALRRLIRDDGVRGMTSNPAIFAKAISGSGLYDEEIRSLARGGRTPLEIYETLSQSDVRAAADEFRHVWDATRGLDGHVSLEVNPHLAHDAEGTVVEARRLRGLLDRPNVLVKVPATDEGVEAFRRLTEEGIGINVTLIFGEERHRQVVDAYLAGLEARSARGEPLDAVVSVASFFVSRIDSLIDPLLDELRKRVGPEAREARALRGQIATCSAKTAYQTQKRIFGSERFRSLAARGARIQRLLWASTGTKDPAFGDLKYVEALVGPDTVDTVPLETLEAYKDHGDPKNRVEEDLEGTARAFERLTAMGLHLDELVLQLENEGVEKFIEPFDRLLLEIQNKAKG